MAYADQFAFWKSPSDCFSHGVDFTNTIAPIGYRDSTSATRIDVFLAMNVLRAIALQTGAQATSIPR